ncbi:IS110 family transposase [Neisseria dentiae]|uniref:IS110 family transposase n=1 Tax=Neisseria dentiae TaxID=194197 RepID=UPI00359FCE45
MRNVVGLDISKQTFDAAVIINGVEDTAKFTNDKDGFEKLKGWLSRFDSQDVHVCMEATGNYYEDVADYLAQFYKVSVINPLKISKYAESRFVRTKTDKQDAKLIAQYCRTAENKDLPLRKTADADNYRLKRLSALYGQLIDDCTAQKNRKETAKDEFVLSICQNNIKHLQQQIKAVKDEIDKLIQKTHLREQVERLAEIPAIGRLTAAILLNHLTSSDFQTANQFIAFAGLAPKTKESGTSVKGKGSLAKQGNRKLRAALFMPAMVAYRFKYFPDFIARLESKGKPKKVIIVALMRKLAVIAYHLHKNQCGYDKSRYLTA